MLLAPLQQRRQDEDWLTENGSTSPVTLSKRADPNTDRTKAAEPTMVLFEYGHFVVPNRLPSTEAQASPIPTDKTPVKFLIPLPSSHNPPAHPVSR